MAKAKDELRPASATPRVRARPRPEQSRFAPIRGIAASDVPTDVAKHGHDYLRMLAADEETRTA